MRGSRGAVVALVALLSAASLASSAAATDTWTHVYAGQGSGASVRGVDGYIRTSTTTALPATQGHSHWINLNIIETTTSVKAWEQIGQYQGSSWAFSSGDGATHVREYYEDNGVCGYIAHDLGYPARANEAYYITVASSSVAVCGSNYVHPVYFRLGSYTDPPVAIGYAAYATGQPTSSTELIYFWDAGIPPVGTDRFGLNDSGSVVAGYGLHLLLSSSSTWYSWTSSIATTSTSGDSPPYYVSRSAYSAFVTQRTAP